MTLCLQAGLAAGMLVVSTVWAAAATMPLVPVDTQIGLTVYAMGMFAQEGHFSRFSGTLSVDPGRPGSCRVTMQVEVASLVMTASVGAHMALGPTMLDAPRFPTLHYEGDCDAARTSGQLTLHGVTRPLTLAASRSATRISAHGSLRRQDFGILGFPGLVGSRIDIGFSVDLSPDLARELPR